MTENLYQIGHIVTATEPVIENTETKEQYNIVQALTVMMNDLQHIKKRVG